MFLKNCEMLLVRYFGNPERRWKVAAPYTPFRRVSVNDLPDPIKHIAAGKPLLRSSDNK